MAIISIFSASFCNGEDVAGRLASDLGYRHMRDADVAAETAQRLGVPEDRLLSALSGAVSDPRRCLHQNLPCLSCLRFVLADLAGQAGLVLSGLCGLLLPQAISHVLRVCLIASEAYRLAAAGRELGPEAGLSRLHQDDQRDYLWGRNVLGRDPFHYELYDLLIPMDRNDPAGAAGLIGTYAGQPFLAPTPDSRSAVADFALEARVELALGEDSALAMVDVEEGVVRLSLTRSVLMLGRLKRRLSKAVSRVEGVRGVEFAAGPGFGRTGHSRRLDSLEVHPNAFIVPRGREFLPAASDRVNASDIDTALFVPDGQAGSLAGPAPDVLVLDLKDPAVDGREALRALRARFPDTAVIVLTGHGSSADGAQYLALGAVAFLQKPVDIETLAGSIREARQKARRQ